MNPLGYPRDACGIGRALEILGEKWTILVLREAFSGVRRFSDFQRILGAPKPVLSRRLQRLVDEGLLSRQPYQDPGDRPREEYRLTPAGRDLYPVLAALRQWGEAHVPGAEPFQTQHRGCGEPARVELVCAADHHLGSVREVWAPQLADRGLTAAPASR